MMTSRWSRPLTLLALMALGLAGACEPNIGPNPFEAWNADLTDTDQVLFMGLTRRDDGSVTGNAELSELLNPGIGELLTITGTRIADSLELTFARPLGGTYRFAGRYARNGAALVGTLDGGAFTQLPVFFRRQ